MVAYRGEFCNVKLRILRGLMMDWFIQMPIRNGITLSLSLRDKSSKQQKVLLMMLMMFPRPIKLQLTNP